MQTTPKIYIESCQFIDMAKHRANLKLHDDATEEAKRRSNVWYCDKLLEAARAGQITIYTSFITIAECTGIQDGNAMPSDDVKRFYMALLSSGKSGVTLIQPTLGIMDRARSLRWNSGITIGGIDAIHVASAIQMKCEEILTTDRKFFTNADKLKDFALRVCQASDTKCLPASYTQYELTQPPPAATAPPAAPQT
jgi:predicted nucleic acid-binding protein